MKPAHWVGFWCFKETIKPEFWTNTLRKSLQTTSGSPCRMCRILTTSVPSTTSKQCFELTSSVLSTTSKQCFEQPTASSLVCSLIFIEYKNTALREKFSISQILGKRLHSSFYWTIIGWYKAFCNKM